MFLDISTLQVLIDAVAHVVADGVVATLFVGGVAFASRRRWRSEVQRLFEVDTLTADTVKMRLSRIQVIPQGTSGTVPITEGFHGPAMTEAEYDYARRLADAIQSPPLVGLFRAVSDRLGVKSLGIPIVCDIRLSDRYPRVSRNRAVDLSPDSEDAKRIEDELGQGPYILVGSPVYNVLTRYVLEHSGHYAYFKYLPTPERGFTVTRYDCSEGGNSTWRSHDFKRFQPRLAEEGEKGAYTEYFIVQKFPVTKFGSVIFLCTGTCTSATVAAVDVLGQYLRGGGEWARIVKQFGGNHFACLYRVTIPDREVPPVRMPQLHREWPADNWSLTDMDCS